MKSAAILLAGGGGTRCQSIAQNKTLMPLAGYPLFSYSYRAFRNCSLIAVVYRTEEQRAQLSPLTHKSTQPILWVKGGQERQDSVHNALLALPQDTTHVLIHDVARPLLTPQLVERVLTTLQQHPAAVLAHRVCDTIKKATPITDAPAPMLKDLDRSTLWAMETPQGFAYPLILDAYNKVQQNGIRITDDTSAVSLLGVPVFLIENTTPNLKLTTPADAAYLQWLLETNSVTPKDQATTAP